MSDQQPLGIESLKAMVAGLDPQAVLAAANAMTDEEALAIIAQQLTDVQGVLSAPVSSAHEALDRLRFTSFIVANGLQFLCSVVNKGGISMARKPTAN